MKRGWLSLLLVLIGYVGFAQNDPQNKPQTKQPTTMLQTAAQSPEMSKMVDSFAGIWRLKITLYKGVWYPQDGTARGRAAIRSGPAGNSIIEQVSSNGQLGNFAGHGVYWYDKQAGSFAGLWCDSMDPRGCGPVGKGGWEGDNLVYTNDIDMGQAKLHIRETYSNISKDAFDFLIEGGMGDAPLTKMMSIHYVRASATKPAAQAAPDKK